MQIESNFLYSDGMQRKKHWNNNIVRADYASIIRLEYEISSVGYVRWS